MGVQTGVSEGDKVTITVGRDVERAGVRVGKTLIISSVVGVGISVTLGPISEVQASIVKSRMHMSRISLDGGMFMSISLIYYHRLNFTATNALNVLEQ